MKRFCNCHVPVVDLERNGQVCTWPKQTPIPKLLDQVGVLAIKLLGSVPTLIGTNLIILYNKKIKLLLLLGSVAFLIKSKP